LENFLIFETHNIYYIDRFLLLFHWRSVSLRYILVRQLCGETSLLHTRNPLGWLYNNSIIINHMGTKRNSYQSKKGMYTINYLFKPKYCIIYFYLIHKTIIYFLFYLLYSILYSNLILNMLILKNKCTFQNFPWPIKHNIIVTRYSRVASSNHRFGNLYQRFSDLDKWFKCLAFFQLQVLLPAQLWANLTENW